MNEPTYAVPADKHPPYWPSAGTVDRFQQQRWSETRQAIHAMKRGAVLSFPPEEYFNCLSTTQRLNSQYSGVRKWRMTVKGRAATITRTK